MVLGVAVAADRVCRWTGARSQPQWYRAGVLLGLGLLAASRLVDPDPRAFQHNRADDDALRPGQALLADSPDQNATIIGNGDQFVSLEYLTEIWGVRSDVRAARLSEAGGLLQKAVQPLYVTRETLPLVLQQASGSLHLSSHGVELVEVRFKPIRELPKSAKSINAHFGDSLQLVAYQCEENNPMGRGETIRPKEARQLVVTLFWQTRNKLEQDWSVSVRPLLDGQLLSREGNVLQVDAANPVGGFYPISRWMPGEIVRDDYAIPLAPDQAYNGIQIVVYRALPQGFENLGVAKLTLTR
jgi:hypothetical protein